MNTHANLGVIREAKTDAQLATCFPVMSQLRPALTCEDFTARVNAQRGDGYRLVWVDIDGVVACVAGFRVMCNLAWGRFLYVDDLVTDAAHRSKGYGKSMLVWLRDEARRTGCTQFHLDSGVQRKDAHRFYLREGMELTTYHFAEPVKSP